MYTAKLVYTGLCAERTQLYARWACGSLQQEKGGNLYDRMYSALAMPGIAPPDYPKGKPYQLPTKMEHIGTLPLCREICPNQLACLAGQWKDNPGWMMDRGLPRIVLAEILGNDPDPFPALWVEDNR